MAITEEILRTKEKYAKELLARTGVHAVGVGLKERGGVLTDELAIVCFTEKKLELSKLNPDEVIPPLLDGIPTDVQEAAMFRPFTTDPGFLAQAVRPLDGGLKIWVDGMPDDDYGTLGFVGMLADQTMVAVSNQHVLLEKGKTVFQPTNAKHNDIGTTGNVLLSPTLDGGYMTLTTTGEATVYRWSDFHSQYELVSISGWDTVRDRLPYPVWKTGAKTGTTFGQIIWVDVGGVRIDGWHYEHQLGIRPPAGDTFALGGDSGSAIMSQFTEGWIMGLLWGGDSARNVILASPILNVMNELGIHIVTGPTQQLQEPVVVPPAEELLARLKSDQGRRVSSFLVEYGPIVRDLIYSDRRVGVTWARNHGHEICNVIIENMAMKSTPLPAEMMGAPTQPALEELGAVLIERGSPALGSAIEAVRADIVWLIGRAYSEAAAES